MVRAILAGVDTGITTGIAILDVHGNLLAIISERELGRNEVIKLITKFGRPLIIATDKNPLPRSIEKIASALGSKVYFPETSLSVVEKQELTKEFKDFIKDDHELDALAACIKSWKKYRELFIKVENTLKNLGLLEIFEDVITRLLREDSENINKAINEILKESKEPKEKIEKKTSVQEYENLIKDLQMKLMLKERKIQNLIEQSNTLNKALRRVKQEFRELEKVKLRFEKFDRIKKELEELKDANELLKKFEKVEEKGFHPVIEIRSVDGLELEELNKKINLANRVVFSHSTENLNLLNRFGLKALLVEDFEKVKNLEKLEFPVLSFKDEIQTLDGIKVIKREILENALKEAKKIGLIEWLKEYRRRKV